MHREAERAIELLKERGATSLDDLVGLLNAQGVNVPDEDELEDALLEEATVLWLPDERLVAADHLLDGSVFTHRPDEHELAGDFLFVDPDFTSLDMAESDDNDLGLTDGRTITVRSVEDVFDAYDLDDEDRTVFAGPPGWLSDIEPGEYVGLRLQHGRLERTRLTAGDIQPAPDATMDQLVAAYQQAVAHDDSDAPAPIRPLVAQVVINDPDLFRRPRPPLDELFDAAGLETRYGMVAPLGMDWGKWWMDETGAELYGLDEMGMEGLRLLTSAYHIFQLTGFQEPESSTDVNSLAVGLAMALSEPGVALAFADHVLGTNGDELAQVQRFTALLIDTKPPHPAGFYFIQGRCAEWAEDVAGGEGALRAALEADAMFTPALLDMAWYAADRGDARRAVTLMRQADTEPDDPQLTFLDDYALPGPATVGRNDRCPCGSGRKYKHCCAAHGGYTLADRALWLYGKAVVFTHRGPQQPRLQPIMLARAGAEDPDDAPEQFINAYMDPVVRDIALFEGGLLRHFLDVRGALLPPDERALGEEWTQARHGLYEVLEVTPGEGLTFRNEVTGEAIDVREITATFGRDVGDHIFTLVLNDSEALEMFGRALTIPGHQADSLRQLLAEDPTAEALAAWLHHAYHDAYDDYDELHVELAEHPERQSWLFPDPTGSFNEIDLSLLDPADEDDRRILIEADHEDLASALDDGMDEIVIEGTIVNPRLHLAVHEIVANQILADEPAESWMTAMRLAALGYDRHEVLHMVGSAVVEEIWQAQHEGNPYDHDRFVAALNALPDAWEADGWEENRPEPSPYRSHRRRRPNPHRPHRPGAH